MEVHSSIVIRGRWSTDEPDSRRDSRRRMHKGPTQRPSSNAPADNYTTTMDNKPSFELLLQHKHSPPPKSWGRRGWLYNWQRTHGVHDSRAKVVEVMSHCFTVSRSDDCEKNDILRARQRHLAQKDISSVG